MALDPSIFGMANRPTVALENPMDIAMKQMAMQNQQMQMDQQRQAMQDAAGFRQQTGMSPGMAKHQQELATAGWRTQEAKTAAQKAIMEMTSDQRKRAHEATMEFIKTASPLMDAKTPDEFNVGLQEALKLHDPDGSKGWSQMAQGMTQQKLKGMILAAMDDKAWMEQAFPKVTGWHEGVGEDGKPAVFGLQGGKPVKLEGVKPATKQPLVQVGFSQPFEVTDPETGKPKLVQQDKGGNLREVKGYGPKGGDNKPLTEAQGNALGFGVRARDAHKIMSGLEDKGVNVATLFNRTIGATPIAGNYTKSAEIQKAEQAQRNFVTAVLRKESGAAISAGEFDTEAKKYFPQPGDSKEVREQKREARQRAIEVLQIQAGRDLPEVVKAVKDVKAKTGPKPGDVVDGYVFNGGNPANAKNWKKQ